MRKRIVAAIVALFLAGGCAHYHASMPGKVKIKENPSGTKIIAKSGPGAPTMIKIKSNPSGTKVKVK